MLEFYKYTFFAGWVTLFILAVMLLVPDINSEKEFNGYKRSRAFCGLSSLAFGIGLLIHWIFLPRLYHPYISSALTLTYFHIGGILLTISHTSLLNPQYICRKIYLRSLTFFFITVLFVWIGAFSFNDLLMEVAFVVFTLHQLWIIYDFYTAYRNVIRHIADVTSTDVESFIKWLPRSGYTIILLGTVGVILLQLFSNSYLKWGIFNIFGYIIFVYIAVSHLRFAQKSHVILLAIEESLEMDKELNPSEIPSVEAVKANMTDTYSMACAKLEAWLGNDKCIKEDVTVAELAREIGTNRTYIAKYFADKGTTFRECINKKRLSVALRLLSNRELTIDDIAYKIGLSRPHLYRLFRLEYGMTPSEYRATHT